MFSRLAVTPQNDMSELNQFKAEFFKLLSRLLRIRKLDEWRKGWVGVSVLCTRLDVELGSLLAFAICSVIFFKMIH